MSIIDYILVVLSLLGALRLLWQLVKSIREKDFGLDVLALIAIISTLIVHEFIASFVVVLMTLTGEFLEHYAAKKAQSQLDELFKAVPQKAHLVEGDDIKDVLVEDVQIGEVLQVLAGEVIPVDGITQIAGDFDESALTGESLPVHKEIGEQVLSGSVVIGSAVRIEAAALASESQYQQILELVDNARNEKNHTVKLASTVSIPFTVVSLLIAGIAWFVSRDPVRFAEVLVLATPCPLLIAAPVAFIGGVSRAAREGIIIKSPVVLEVIAKVRVMAFDKTGTLTEGRPEVVEVEHVQSDALVYAYQLEILSKHVFAEPITKYLELQKIQESPDFKKCTVEEIEEVAGKGIQAKT
jgi:P-type E1-E2 ATPase